MANKPPFKPFKPQPFVQKPVEVEKKDADALASRPILSMPAIEPKESWSSEPFGTEEPKKPEPATPVSKEQDPWHPEPYPLTRFDKPEPAKPVAKAVPKSDPQRGWSDIKIIAYHRSQGAPAVSAADIAATRYEADTYPCPAVYFIAPDYFCVEELNMDLPADPINPDRFKWQLIATHYGRNIHRARG